MHSGSTAQAVADSVDASMSQGGANASNDTNIQNDPLTPIDAYGNAQDPDDQFALNNHANDFVNNENMDAFGGVAEEYFGG